MTTAPQMPDIAVIKRGYEFQVNMETGEVFALTAGDQGYEPTGIFISAGDYLTKEDVALREAARRLSAPRVGDGAEPTDPNFFIHIFWPSHDKFKMLLLDVVKRRDTEWRALSAPPAASADEREDDTDNMVCYWCGKRDAELQGDDSLDDGPGGAWFVQCRECHATGPIMQTEPEALTAWKSGPGYRKRAAAPAQSVGQSAAQGVGEFAAELVKWCEERIASNADAGMHISGGSSALRDVIRRLSALPKGQKGDV